MVVRMKCENEWNSIHQYSPSETFVVLTTDQFVRLDDGLLQQRNRGRIATFVEKPL